MVLIIKSALKKAVLRFSDSVQATATHWVNCNAREGSSERGMVGTLLENPPSILKEWMFPTSCLISDAQEKGNSERGDQNQNPVGQKPT